ncbi:MAG: IS630 family transposase [Pseudolabrys sp.]
MEGTRSVGASVPTVQAFDRYEIRRLTARCGRALCRPACPRHRALGRREEPNPGARPHPAGAAVEKGPPRHHDPRLQAHGTTTLFAALNVLDGTVIGCNIQRHRHQEFIRFLNTIETEVPAGKIVHVILDNYVAHNPLKVRAWLDRHQRFVFHFTPTSCSWLNAVEGFFAKLARRRLKRGVFRSVVDLQAALGWTSLRGDRRAPARHRSVLGAGGA